MNQQADVHGAFQSPLRARLAEAYHAVRLLRSEVGVTVTLDVLTRAAAQVGPLQLRLSQQARARTSEIAVVEQAICWSIALYQALLQLRDEAGALAVMRKLVVASGQRLMAQAFPPLAGDDPLGELRRFVIPAMLHAQRHGLYCLANISGERDAPGSLGFDVTYCRYVELSRLAGAAPLAECFCAVDGPFFADICPDLQFSCPRRLAAGDRACTFNFALQRTSDDE